MLKVRKLGFSTLHIAFVKLDLADFLLFLLLLSTTLLLLTQVNSRALIVLKLYFNIKLSSTTILLKP